MKWWIGLIAIAAIATVAQAAPPTGYRCGKGGKPVAKEQRCDCPAGKAAARDTDGVAICKAVETPQRSAKVKIDSAPQGAQIFVDAGGASVGVTPWNGTLAIGSHTITVVMLGYERKAQPFQVAATTNLQELFVPLTKQHAEATVDVRVDADRNVLGARVWLDGQDQGTAPVQIPTRAGRHLIEIKKDGFEPYSWWISVDDGQVDVMTPVLKAIVVESKYGSIFVDADVQDAEVFIDGSLYPDHTPTVAGRVVEGIHVIEVRKDPAIPWKQAVQVVADKQTKVRAELAATMSGGVGVIRVLSDAPGAAVWLDDRSVGETPLDLKDVPAGEHTVAVVFAGRSKSIKVTVTPGASQVVKLDPD